MNSTPLLFPALLLIALAILLVMFRFLKGPSAADRIVAADSLTVVATGTIALFSLLLESPLYLDLALLFGALAFVGVIALARAIEQRNSEQNGEPS